MLNDINRGQLLGAARALIDINTVLARNAGTPSEEGLLTAEQYLTDEFARLIGNYTQLRESLGSENLVRTAWLVLFVSGDDLKPFA